jgi:sec-independent protein translocase protein TatA
MFGTLGLPELVIILVIVIVIFGVNKLPKLGKGLGEGIRNFKDSVKSDGKDETDNNSGPEGVEPK